MQFWSRRRMVERCNGMLLPHDSVADGRTAYQKRLKAPFNTPFVHAGFRSNTNPGPKKTRIFFICLEGKCFQASSWATALHTGGGWTGDWLIAMPQTFASKGSSHQNWDSPQPTKNTSSHVQMEPHSKQRRRSSNPPSPATKYRKR